MSNYILGSDVLVDQYITIRVKNVPELVKKEGGTAGSFLNKLAPQTIMTKVYNEIKEKLSSGFKAEGADVDVKIVYGQPSISAPIPRDLVTGIGLGVIGLGMIWAAWSFGLSKVFMKNSSYKISTKKPLEFEDISFMENGKLRTARALNVPYRRTPTEKVDPLPFKAE